MANMVWTGVIAGTIAVGAAAVAFGYSSIFDSTDGPSDDRGRFIQSAETRMLKYDVDKDSRISRQELDAGLSAEFRNVDANTDGRLDAAEIQRHIDFRRDDRNTKLEAWRVKAKAQGLDPNHPPFDLNERDNVDTLRYGDWNLDGVITIEEFGGKARAQFMRSDRNGDGVITPEELHRKKDGKPPRAL